MHVLTAKSIYIVEAKVLEAGVHSSLGPSRFKIAGKDA